MAVLNAAAFSRGGRPPQAGKHTAQQPRSPPPPRPPPSNRSARARARPPRGRPPPAAARTGPPPPPPPAPGAAAPATAEGCPSPVILPKAGLRGTDEPESHPNGTASAGQASDSSQDRWSAS